MHVFLPYSVNALGRLLRYLVHFSRYFPVVLHSTVTSDPSSPLIGLLKQISDVGVALRYVSRRVHIVVRWYASDTAYNHNVADQRQAIALHILQVLAFRWRPLLKFALVVLAII